MLLFKSFEIALNVLFESNKICLNIAYVLKWV